MNRDSGMPGLNRHSSCWDKPTELAPSVAVPESRAYAWAAALRGSDGTSLAQWMELVGATKAGGITQLRPVKPPPVSDDSNGSNDKTDGRIFELQTDLSRDDLISTARGERSRI